MISILFFPLHGIFFARTPLRTFSKNFRLIMSENLIVRIQVFPTIKELPE